MSLLFPLHFHYQVPSCMKAGRRGRNKEESGKRGENHSAMQKDGGSGDSRGGAEEGRRGKSKDAVLAMEEAVTRMK